MKARMCLVWVILLGALAWVVPGPRARGARAGSNAEVFAVVGADFMSPLISSPRALQTLNTELGLAAQFAGYDQIAVLVNSGSTLEVSTVTRYHGDLLALLSAEYVLDGRARVGGNRVFLGESYWREALGADPEVVGRVQELAGEKYLIAGVVRANPAVLGESDFWLPVSARGAYGGTTALRVIGAVKRGQDCRTIERSIGALLRRGLLEQWLEGSAVRLLPVDRKLVLYPSAAERLARFGSRRKPAV